MNLRKVISAVIVGVVVGSGLVVAPAMAAGPSSPAGLAADVYPDGTVHFEWAASPGASAYRLEWSADAGFPSGSVSTVDTYGRDHVTRWQPGASSPADAPADLYWRVTAFGSGVSTSTLGEPSGANRVQVGLDSAPSPLGPGTNGTVAQIAYPDPTVFSWGSVVGAVSYELEYTSDTLGGGAGVTQRVTGTRFAPVNPLARVDSGGNVLTWKWRVRAQFYNGTTSATPAVYGAWSPEREFQITWDVAPSDLHPADEVTTVHSDLAFSWDAVAGAAKYRVTFGEAADGNGANRTILNPRTIDVFTTTYIPTVQVSDTTRFWQVTPLDYAGNPGTPSAVHQYKKKWTTKDEPSWPSDPGNAAPASITGSLSDETAPAVYLSDFELEWQPLPRATFYDVEVYDDHTNVFTCRTASTSATIMGKFSNGLDNVGANEVLKSVSNCLWETKPEKVIQPGRTYHWRVRGVDLTGSSTSSMTAALPSGAQISSWSETRHLTVKADDRPVPERDAVDLDLDAFAADNPSSASGQPAPLLSWSAVGYVDGVRKNAPAYEVTFYKNEQRTAEIGSVITPSTTLRLNGVFADNITANPYYASVRPVAFETPPWGGTMLLIGGVDNSSIESFEWRKESHAVTGLRSAALSDGSVRLSWNPQSVTGLQDGGSRGYQVRVFNGSTQQGVAKKVEYPFFMAQQPATSTDTSFPSTMTDVPLAPGSNYSFDVAPLDANGNPGPVTKSSTFAVGIATPTVSAPAGVAGSSAALTWSSVPGALKYSVQYRRVGSSTWTSVAGISQTAATINGLDQGNYEWQVRTHDASNLAANVSPWSTTRSFSVGGAPSTVPLKDAVVLPLSDRVLSWSSSVDGATRFQVQIADDVAFTSGVKTYETVATSFAIPDALTASKQYYWRVKALAEPVGASSALRVLATSATDAFTVRTVPAKVTGLGLARSGTGLVATWGLLTGAGTGTDVPITYVVAYREKTSDSEWSGAIETQTAASATSFGVQALAPGTVYQFRVAARNSEGTGPWSDVKELATATAPTAAPSLTVTPKLGELSLKIGTVSANGGSAVTGYRLRYRQGAAGQWTTKDIPVASTHAITGLVNAADYQVSVAAVNAIGAGPSAEVSTRTLGYATTPRTVKAARGDKKATVTWTAPATPNGTVTGYVVQKRLGTTGEWVSATTTGASTLTASLTGLTNGKTYQVRVAAKTSVGVGQYSPSVNVVPAGKPLAPTKVTATSDKKGNITVSWPKASPNGSAVTSYVVHYSTNGTKWSTLKTVSPSTLKVVTTKGTHGKRVYFRVYAKNALGTSPASAKVSVIRK